MSSAKTNMTAIYRTTAALELLAVCASWPLLCGCCASYKHVLIRIEDDPTGRPIAGVYVSPSYRSAKSALSLASGWRDRGFTGTNGLVLLKANYLPHEPTLLGPRNKNGYYPYYIVFITNNVYFHGCGLKHRHSPQPVERLIARDEDFVPTTPDLVAKVPSIKEKERRKAATEEAIAQQKEEARDFWPTAGEPLDLLDRFCQKFDENG